jgi:ferredoxin
MANKNDKVAGNVPGPFYIDQTCCDCDLCRGMAPGIFRRDDEIGMSIVYKQPTTPEEFNEAIEAMESCPTSTIGNDG